MKKEKKEGKEDIKIEEKKSKRREKELEWKLNKSMSDDSKGHFFFPLHSHSLDTKERTAHLIFQKEFFSFNGGKEQN